MKNYIPFAVIVVLMVTCEHNLITLSATMVCWVAGMVGLLRMERLSRTEP